MSNAYYVGLIQVRDPAQWEHYVSQVGLTITQYGGRIIFRGAKRQVMAGEDIINTRAHDRVVTLEFADETAAKRWHDSPEYQRLVQIRDLGADVTLILYTS